MICVFAEITAKPGQRDNVLHAARKTAPAVHAEDGCIEWILAVDSPASRAKYGEDTLLVVEKWASPEALSAHGKTAHMKEFGRAIQDSVTGPAVVHILQLPEPAVASAAA